MTINEKEREQMYVQAAGMQYAQECKTSAHALVLSPDPTLSPSLESLVTRLIVFNCLFMEAQ